jgi:amino acid permease
MKFSKLYKELILPAGLLTSLIIGAGMFSLPFLFVKAGIWMGVLCLIVFASVFSALHLMYAEIIRKTPGEHRFVGFADIYLGRPGFWLSLIATALGLFLVLTVYLILSSSFFRLIWPELPVSAAIFIFWAMGTAPIFMEIKKMANMEFSLVLAMIAIILTIFVMGIFSPTFSVNGLSKMNFDNFFLLYGPALFALSGRSAISSIREYFKKNGIDEQKMNPAIILGTVLPAVVYLLFVLGVIGLSSSPEGVSNDSVSGLVSLPYFMSVAVAILGVFSIWTSYAFLAREAQGILSCDFHGNKNMASFLVGVLPLFFYFAGSQDFTRLVSISGGIFLAIESIMVVLIWQKIKNGKRYLGYPLIVVFALGVLYELLQIF